MTSEGLQDHTDAPRSLAPEDSHHATMGVRRPRWFVSGHDFSRAEGARTL